MLASQSQIRNFSIIAHIDHGKTTLTDRLIELTQGNSVGKANRIMDSNPIEKERGITIKLAPVSLNYQGYTLNLIDTPGHVDFGYEVSRSLAACEGAILVIDSTQGVQAQTLSNFYKAKELGLAVIPVINKIDLPSADVEGTTLEIMDAFGFAPEEIIAVSAKSGLNVEQILDAVIKRIPSPTGIIDAPPRALIITATFDKHKGAIAYMRMVDGVIKDRENLTFMASGKSFCPIEIGFFNPHLTKTSALSAGEVGYIATGLKDIRSLAIGDTIALSTTLDDTQPLPGYRPAQPVVFMEIYPVDADDFPNLADAALKLSYHDAALSFQNTYSNALGSGLKAGFLGILHAEIVLERLKTEFDIDLIATAPTVDYLVTTKDGVTKHIHTPLELPDKTEVVEVKEPIAHLQIFTPERFSSEVIQFCRARRGELISSEFTAGNMKLQIDMPLSELITDFHDQLKSLSSGFASLEYSLGGYVPVDVVQVSILLNGEPVEALSFISTASEAEEKGREMVSRLKEVIPRHMFEIPVQAAIGGKIIARETIKAFRKDVTAKLYGGDVTRRQKLLKKQAAGKKKMKEFGKVKLDQDVFLTLLRR